MHNFCMFSHAKKIRNQMLVYVCLNRIYIYIYIYILYTHVCTYIIYMYIYKCAGV
jgi:hypothetical protein